MDLYQNQNRDSSQSNFEIEDALLHVQAKPGCFFVDLTTGSENSSLLQVEIVPTGNNKSTVLFSFNGDLVSSNEEFEIGDLVDPSRLSRQQNPYQMEHEGLHPFGAYFATMSNTLLGIVTDMNGKTPIFTEGLFSQSSEFFVFAIHSHLYPRDTFKYLLQPYTSSQIPAEIVEFDTKFLVAQILVAQVFRSDQEFFLRIRGTLDGFMEAYESHVTSSPDDPFLYVLRMPAFTFDLKEIEEAVLKIQNIIAYYADTKIDSDQWKADANAEFCEILGGMNLSILPPRQSTVLEYSFLLAGFNNVERPCREMVHNALLGISPADWTNDVDYSTISKKGWKSKGSPK